MLTYSGMLVKFLEGINYIFDKKPCIKKEVKGNERCINTCDSLTFYFYMFLLNFFFRTQQTLEYEGRGLRRGYSAYP